MTALIVVDHPEEWPHEFAAAEVVSADSYLRDERLAGTRQVRATTCATPTSTRRPVTTCRCSRRRAATGVPGVATIQDIKSRSLLRADDELEEIVERSLHTIKSKRFELSVYFGCNVAERHAYLSRALFNLFPMPLLRATFAKSSTTGLWRLRSIAPIPVGDIPAHHGPFLLQVIENHFARRGPAGRAGRTVGVRARPRHFANADERSPPSNREALERFERAARANGFDVEFLNRDDYGRIAEFDALFIRETTAVNHHTYRFASRAHAEGLVVVDDPESIIRCGNKVYLVELANGRVLRCRRRWSSAAARARTRSSASSACRAC